MPEAEAAEPPTAAPLSPESQRSHAAATIIQRAHRGQRNDQQRFWPGMQEIKALFLVRQSLKRPSN